MGVEQRHDGKLYYYRKQRIGDRVVSEYVGRGHVIAIAEREAQREAARKQREREQLEATKQAIALIEADPLTDMVDLLVEAHLLSLGYHKHNRQWRKRRETKP